jgi:large subunit ribosomal protein L25
MADQSATPLPAARREPEGSRSTRRLRRSGEVPGVVYGGGQDPIPFSVNSRQLRHALADAGAVLDLQLDGAHGEPVVLKELVRHPVSGLTTHIDLLRVRLDVAIQAQVVIELLGSEDAPGVKLGGVLEQPLREVTIESLPGTIPDILELDVSGMDIGDTLTLAAVKVPAGVTIIGSADTLVAAITQSRSARAEGTSEIETEVELVGEAQSEAAEADGASDGATATE